MDEDDDRGGAIGAGARAILRWSVSRRTPDDVWGSAWLRSTRSVRSATNLEAVPGPRGDSVMTGGRALERGTSWTPRVIQPMRPTPAAPFHRPGWIYEEKYDGWRVLAYKQGATVRLRSRHGLDCTGRFRALAAAIASVPTAALILDGEVTVLDEHLLSRRDWLRRPDPARSED